MRPRAGWTAGDYDPFGDALCAHVEPGFALDGSPLRSGVALHRWGYMRATVRLRFRARVPRAVMMAAESQIGKPYGGLWEFIEAGKQERNWRQDSDWTCFEHVAWSFWMGGAPLFPELSSYKVLTPPMAQLSTRWNLVFEVEPAHPDRVLWMKRQRVAWINGREEIRYEEVAREDWKRLLFGDGRLAIPSVP